MSLTSDPVVSLRPGVTTTVLLRLQPEGHGRCMQQPKAAKGTWRRVWRSEVTETVEGHLSNNLQPLSLNQKDRWRFVLRTHVLSNPPTLRDEPLCTTTHLCLALDGQEGDFNKDPSAGKKEQSKMQMWPHEWRHCSASADMLC